MASVERESIAGIQYDPIQGQGQGQGHEPLKVGNSAIFKGYPLPHL